MRIFTICFLLLWISVGMLYAQQTRIVNGTLTDPETGEPMPGANVVVKETGAGTTTDVDGNYSVEAPIGSTLVFSFIGYKTMEVLVTAIAPGASNPDSLQHIFRHTVLESKDGKTLSPYFFVKSDDPSVDQMPLKHTSACVQIAGVIADVKVEQVYVNTGKSILEAMYIFPGSTRAAVYAMEMTIGNRKLIARIQEKEKARQEYEAAKQAGKTATLLEQKRPNVFEMNVARILPGDTITVSLSYTELLLPEQGNYEFVYPTVVGPRYSGQPDEQTTSDQLKQSPYQHEGLLPDYTFDLNVTLQSGIPIREISSTSHAIDVNYQSRKKATIGLQPTDKHDGNRDFILRFRLRGSAVESGLLLTEQAGEKFFLLMVEPPERPTPDQVPPREYIFIVDVSGSMHGFPLDVVKQFLHNLISSLRETDKFNVMLFESNNTMLHKTSVLATSKNIREALQMLSSSHGGGGTELLPALKNALDTEKAPGTSRTFVVVTDGYVNIEQEAFNLVRNNLHEANLFAVGIGSSVNRHLIEGLAHAGMGEPFIVTNEKEAKAAGMKFKTMVENPVLTDIRIDYGKSDVYDVTPIQVPDVFAERPIIIYGKYRGVATDIHVTGLSAGRPYANTIQATDARSEGTQAFRYLWARNKIRYLSDFAHLYDDDQAGTRQKMITQLGLQYNLLTAYTSFIAVDTIVRQASDSSQRVMQPLPLPEGVSDMALAGRMAGLSLSPDVMSLSEVVVMAYGVNERRAITYCSVSVTNNNIVYGSSDIATSLNGSVAGVRVNQNSQATASNASIMIRGASSLVSDNTPLYVIDGIPIDMANRPVGTAGTEVPDRLAGLDPQNIASITVLKSNSATAIYGSRGANGVVLINTKMPTHGKVKVSYASSVTLQQTNKLPEMQHTYSQGQPTAGSEQWRGPDEQELFSWGPSLADLAFDGRNYPYDQNGKLVLQGSGQPAKAYNPYDIFRNGFTFANHIDVGKASTETSWQLSAAHSAQVSLLPNASSNANNASVFVSHKLNSKLTLGLTANMTSTHHDLVQRGDSPSSVMYSVLTTPPTFDASAGHPGHLNSESYRLADNSPRSYAPGLVDNAYGSIANNPAYARFTRVMPSVFAKYKPVAGLSIDYSLAGEYNEDNLMSAFDVQSAAFQKGQFTNRNEYFTNLLSSFVMHGDKTILQDRLGLQGTAGLIYSTSTRSLSRTDASALIAPGNFKKENAADWTLTHRDFTANNTRMFVRGETNYKSWLSMDVTSTHERSTTLGRMLHSESAGLSATLTELPWAESIHSVVNFGKIFANIASIEKEAPLFADPNSFDPEGAGTPVPERVSIIRTANLKPERVRSAEAGISADLLDNRIDLTATYFASQTADAYVPQLTASGASLMNGARLRMKGFELSVSGYPVRQSLVWQTQMTFTSQNTIVQSLPNGIERIALAGFSSVSSGLIAGEPFGVLYGTAYKRNNAGRIIIGQDGFPMVGTNLQVLGNPNPKWTMGISNAWTFRNFSLDIMVNIKRGGVMWNGTHNVTRYFGTSASTNTERNVMNYVFEGVTEEGERNTKAVNFTDANLDNNRWVRYGKLGVAEDAIENAGWVRIQHIALAYSLPGHLAEQVKAKTVSIMLVARNVFTFTSYSGIDPQTNLTGNSQGFGLDYFNLPSVRSYGVTLKASW